MKKLLFLVNNEGINFKFYRYLEEILRRKMIKVDYAFLTEIAVSIIKNKVSLRFRGKDLKDYDFVFIRKTGKRYLPLAATLAYYLDFHRVAYLDTILKESGPFADKVGSLVKLALAKIPVCDTYFNYPRPEEKIGFPVIGKSVYSQRGEGVYVLRRQPDLEKLSRLNPLEHYLFQPLLAISREYRLLVLGNKVAVVQLKEKRDYSSFAVGFDRQAEDVFFDPGEIDERIKNLAVKAAGAIKLQVAGIDLAILDDGRPLVVEVNRGPGLNNNPAKSPEFSEIAKYLCRILT